MLKSVFRVLNVQKAEEERPALLLLGYGFFMGVFLATYRVVVETLFLDTQGENLKEAFFISGILGVISTALFTIAQKHISFKKLAIFNLIAVFFFISGAYISLATESSRIFTFIIYVMLFPVTSIMLLCFWGLFGRIFDIRQSKRIIGSIDAGQLIAIILAFVSVPFFIEYVSNVTDLLIVSSISIFACLFFLVFINQEIRFSEVGDNQGRSETIRFSKLFKDNYAIVLSLFIGISIICLTFVDYAFLKITEQQYTDEISLAKFLSYMYMSVMVFTLIMQTFVNERLIASYGLKIALMILPVILGIFTIGAIVTGNLFGYLPTSENFIWFFLFIVLSKFFSNSIREALEVPTFKIFFMPLKINIRFDVQAKIEGVINESSRLLAGTMILVIGAFSFFDLIHYSYFLLAIVIGYFFVTGGLYNEYRNNVRKKLESHEEESSEIDSEMFEIDTILKNLDQIEDAGMRIFSLKVIEKLDREKFIHFLPSQIDSKNKVIKKYALRRLNDLRSLSGSLNPNKIKIIEDTEKSKEDISNWLNKILHTTDNFPLVENISQLAKSDEVEERIDAINMIMANPVEESIPYIIELLVDLNFTVQSLAIHATGKLKRADLYPFLIDKLSSSTYGDLTVNALVEIGDDIIQYLEVIFQKTDQDPQTQLRIIRVYEKIKSERSKEVLWNKIDYPDKKIVSQILLALANSGFKAEGYQTVRIKYVIESDINDIIWNIHALDKVQSSEIGDLLRKSLEEENESHFHHIYMLLSMIYDQYSIRLIRSNIESGTHEGITYAIELLDVLLAEDLKDRIIPLFDDISNQDKIKKLQVFYPHMLGDFMDVIKQIINKEFNQINRWSKALAIYWVGMHKEESMLYELISNLFNPDPLIRTTAGWSLYQINPEYYEEHTQRIERDRKTDIDSMILQKEKIRNLSFKKPLTIDKVFFMNGLPVFKMMPTSFVVNLMDYSEELYLRKNQKLKISEDTNNYFYLIYDGYVNLLQRDIVINSLSDKEFLGEIMIEEISENDLVIHPLVDTILIRVFKEKLYELLSNDHELALEFLHNTSVDINASLEKLDKSA
jgi:ATP/ADP translocase